jgi:hypothetical protein
MISMFIDDKNEESEVSNNTIIDDMNNDQECDWQRIIIIVSRGRDHGFFHLQFIPHYSQSRHLLHCYHYFWMSQERMQIEVTSILSKESQESTLSFPPFNLVYGVLSVMHAIVVYINFIHSFMTLLSSQWIHPFHPTTRYTLSRSHMSFFILMMMMIYYTFTWSQTTTPQSQHLPFTPSNPFIQFNIHMTISLSFSDHFVSWWSVYHYWW